MFSMVIKTLFSLFLTVLALSPAAVVFAVDTPTFPTCPNSGGTLLASYPSGIHGVPGRTQTYTGSDIVYSISDGVVVQCLCQTDAAGVQTNWWKVGQMPEIEKDLFLRQGWVVIPNGTLWGLSEGEWLAQNIDFTCGERGGGSSSSSSSSSSTPSSVLSIPQILGFADTGRQKLFRLLIAGIGVSFLMVGVLFFFIRSLDPRNF